MPDAMSEAETLAVLKQACEAAGLSADSARLLRLGSNAVYRLTAPVVARIARPEADVAPHAEWLPSPGGSNRPTTPRCALSPWTSPS